MSTQTLVTFVLFSLEAYMHFLIGKNSGQQGPFQLHFPSLSESIQIFGTVYLFSVLTTRVTQYMST